MEIRSIHLGGMFHAEEEIQMTSTMANFVGQLQGFVYNGNRYCESFVCLIADSLQKISKCLILQMKQINVRVCVHCFVSIDLDILIL